MKKLFLSIVILQITCSLLKAQTTFQRLYNTTSYTWFSLASSTSDGGSIVCGSVGSASTDYLVSKLDMNGSVQWAKHIGSWMGDENGIKISESVGGGYYLMGTTTSQDPYGEVNLISLDISGNVLWNKTYSGGDFVYISYPSIRQTISGGFIISGTVLDTSGMYFLLIKTDISGNIIWSKAYGEILYDKEECYDVEECNDGGFIAVGDGEDTGIYMIKTDVNGTLVWAKKYSTASSDYIPGISINKTFDGGYIISGTLYDALGYDPMLMKIDASGNVTWAKKYSYPPNYLEGCYSVVATLDGGFAMTNVLYGYETNQELTKVNSSGKTQWSKHYTLTMSNSSYFTQNLSTTNSGGFLIATTANDPITYNYLGYLIKTDSLGNSGCNEVSDSIIDTPISFIITSPSVTANFGSSKTISFSSENILLQVSSNCDTDVGIFNPDEMNSDVVIYPNPFFTSATIQLTNGNNLGQKHTFELYDIVGRVIKKIEFSGLQTEIKRDELQSGIYLWRITDKTTVIENGKLVIE